VTIGWLQHAYSRPLSWWAILTRKVGHTDLVLVSNQSSLPGLRARLQASVCSNCDFCHPG